MSRAVLGACLLSLLACEQPVPPPSYELRFPFSVPDGTEVVVDGKVVGAFTKQRARIQLPKAVTLVGAGSLAVRFATVCGHADRPFEITGDAVEGLDKSRADNQTIDVALTMDPAHLVTLTTVWLDPEAKGEVTIGTKALNKGPNRVLLTDCDDVGRGLTVGTKGRGPVPVVDAKAGEQLFIPADPSACFALRERVYEKGALKPEVATSKTLSGKPAYRVPLLSFFLREAPETIETVPGAPRETKFELERVDCVGAGGSGG
ncbi:MAG TPA: hypothetical protein ENK57_00945 [Polyangiaceae bacterium]|nr:hypothetical protein [Polyangiaceae bacterium]